MPLVISHGVNYVISQEKLIDELENAAKEVKEHQIIDDNSISKAKDEEDEEDDDDKSAMLEHNGYDRNALEDDDAKRKKKLHIDLDDAKASAGFQNITNAGRFWRAAQVMGTRKKAKLNQIIQLLLLLHPQIGSCRIDHDITA